VGGDFQAAIVLGLCIVGLMRVAGADDGPESASAAIAQPLGSLPPVALATPLQSPQPPPAPTAPAVIGYEDQITRLQVDLTSARQRCLAQLQATARYQTAAAEVEALDAQVDQLRKGDPYRELPEVSRKWIEAKNVVGRLTAAALADDPDVQRLQMELRLRGAARR
jgi:hypothetical protein